MSLKHTVTRSVRTDAGTGISDSAVYTGDAEVNCSDTVAASTTREIDVAIDVSQLQSFFIESDQDVTLKTNSTGSPAQTIALTAKKALLWNSGDTASNPLTTDITKLYFVNATLNIANVKAGFLLNVGS